MQLNLTINLSAHAFEANQGDEVAAILRKIADKVEGLSGPDIDAFSAVAHDAGGRRSALHR